jgi:type II protein arginine methyltransferase
MSSSNSIYDRPGDFLAMGSTLVNAGKGETAVGLVRQAQQARPNDRQLAALGRVITTQDVPDFHYAMLLDRERNALYRRAIEQAAPGKLVLDIGTGSGLLAMMAARAGARHVVACEMNPMLAATAREIIAANGLADRITVHAVHSEKLDRERDLMGGAELVISEIISDNLVGERVLPSLAHARKELCRPGARFLPEAALIRVALAETPLPPLPIGTVEGFDLSPFNRHFDPSIQLNPGSKKIRLRSPAVDLFDYALDGIEEGTSRREARADLVSDGGRATGIVQWIKVRLAPGLTYENRPVTDESLHWVVRFTPFKAPRETQPGQRIPIAGWCGHDRLCLWEAE